MLKIRKQRFRKFELFIHTHTPGKWRAWGSNPDLDDLKTDNPDSHGLYKKTLSNCLLAESHFDKRGEKREKRERK